MTNNKNFFNDELDDLFEGVSLDEASILAGGEIKPTQEEYEEEGDELALQLCFYVNHFLICEFINIGCDK